MKNPVREWVDDQRTRLSRTTPGPVLVRGAVFVCTLGALILAFPTEVTVGARAGLLLPVLAVLPALAPRGRIPTFVLLLAVLGWLAATAAYAEPVALPRLLVLAGLLYLAHTLTAMAAVLPYDAVVAPTVLARWLVRPAVVLASTVAFGLAVAAGLPAFEGRAYLVAAIAGLLLVGALAGLLAALRRRP